MNLNEIQDLIKFVSKAGVSEVEIEQKDFKIVIKTDSKKAAPVQQIIQAAPMAVAPAVNTVQAIAPVADAPKAVAPVENSNLLTIKSPMIGTFYRSSGPDKPLFVNVGDTIKKGDTICIIEAMKLFNEIEAEFSGKIVKVLVDNSSPVEYDQPLFLVEPA
jgi:acetyl-CoA carboxylase biotin carboxyl carrier protein